MNIPERATKEQIDTMTDTEGNIRVSSVPGSGKTFVLTYRIAYLITEMFVEPSSIVALTFTNKAAKEMKERVDRLVGMGADSAWIMTFHAACVRILRRYICRIGYDNNFTIYDTDDQKSVIKDILKRKNLDPKQYKDRTILSVISNAKDNLISPDDMYQSSGGNYNTMKTAEIYREYQEQIKELEEVLELLNTKQYTKLRQYLAELNDADIAGLLEELEEEEQRKDERRGDYYGKDTFKNSNKKKRHNIYIFSLEDLDNDDIISMVETTPTFQRTKTVLESIQSKAIAEEEETFNNDAENGGITITF